MSTVAQSVRITFRTSPGGGADDGGGGGASAAVQIVGVAEGSGMDVRTRVSATGAVSLELSLADLAAEDRRGILVELRLPAVDAAAALGAGITAELTWIDCIVAAPSSSVAFVSIRRGATTAATDTSMTAFNAVDPEVQQQRHRLLVAAALETAATAGDAGADSAGIASAIDALHSAMASILTSGISAQQQQLVADLEEAVQRLVYQRDFGGRNASKGLRSTRWNYLAQKGSSPISPAYASNSPAPMCSSPPAGRNT
jgi:hypothetical protein